MPDIAQDGDAYKVVAKEIANTAIRFRRNVMWGPKGLQINKYRWRAIIKIMCPENPEMNNSRNHINWQWYFPVKSNMYMFKTVFPYALIMHAKKSTPAKMGIKYRSVLSLMRKW